MNRVTACQKHVVFNRLLILFSWWGIFLGQLLLLGEGTVMVTAFHQASSFHRRASTLRPRPPCRLPVNNHHDPGHARSSTSTALYVLFESNSDFLFGTDAAATTAPLLSSAAAQHQSSGSIMIRTLQPPAPSSSSIFLAAEGETWRQYVPLAVSALVIVDILLGSPVANTLIGIVRSQSSEQEDETNGENERRRRAATVRTEGERIDTEELANAALERARNALEWNTERDKYKTDSDRMEEMRRKMDNQMRELDEKKKK